MVAQREHDYPGQPDYEAKYPPHVLDFVGQLAEDPTTCAQVEAIGDAAEALDLRIVMVGMRGVPDTVIRACFIDLCPVEVKGANTCPCCRDRWMGHVQTYVRQSGHASVEDYLRAYRKTLLPMLRAARKR